MAHKRGLRPTGLLIGMLLTATLSSAQAPSGVGDLLTRGRNAINDLRYGEAAIVSRQVLAMGAQLNRQETIDALEVLVAAIFPEGGGVQRPDSAKAVIRRLVHLGVRSGISHDLAWRGIDSLYAIVATDTTKSAPSAASAPELRLRDSVVHVAILLANRIAPVEIVDRIRFDCFAVAFDSLDAVVIRAKAPSTLSLALRGTCSRLSIESATPSGTVSLGARTLGSLQGGRGEWWVDPADSADVVVARADGRSTISMRLPRGKFVHAKFTSARDTVPWPTIRSPMEIADAMHLFDGWTPPGKKPGPPSKPKGGRSFKSRMVFGLVGAAAGLGLGLAVPALSCGSTQTVPAGQIWIVKGKAIGPGGDAPGAGSVGACAGTMAGLGLGTFLLSSIGSGGSSPAAQRRYQESLDAYPSAVREWEQNERRRYAEGHPRVRQAMNDEQAALAKVRSGNASIRSGNGQIPPPQIVSEDLPGAIVGTMAGGLPSDVDIAIPKAAAANAGAVAVVIGNRDYVAGLPRPAYAVHDATIMRRYLEDAFGISPDRVLLDSNATSTRMGELLGTQSNESEWALAEMVASRPPNSVDVVVFFSGLATTDPTGKGVLLPVDVREDRVGTVGFSMEQLYRNLQALNARSVTVIVDAAFSGNTEAGPVFPLASSIEATVRPRGNIDVFSAASGEQANRAHRDQGHGLYSYFVMKGLGGAADANNDLRVTVGELDEYVKARIRSYMADLPGSARQTPETFFGNRGRVLVTLLKKQQ